MSALIAVLALVLLVVVVVGIHELGHFTFGKLFGVRVDEFSIGFGPKLVSRRWGETEYAIRALPLGGFVRMAGMIDLPGQADAGERNFFRAAAPKRIVTLLAGVLFNILLAGVVFSLAYTLGTPSVVSASGPAARAGLHDGDSLVSIGGKPIDHSSVEAVGTTVRAAMDVTRGARVPVVYTTSGGAQQTVTLQPQLGVLNTQVSPDPCGGSSALPYGGSLITQIDGKNVGTGDAVQLLASAHYVSGITDPLAGGPCANRAFENRTVPGPIGGFSDTSATVVANWRIGMALDANGKPLPAAIAAGWGRIPDFFVSQVSGIIELFTNSNTGGPLGANGFVSPVGIASQTVSAAQSGFQSYLEWMAFISLSLALINLLPIPFLDGGKVVLVVIEAIRHKRLDPRREMGLYAAGAALVGIFTLFVIIAEVHRALSGS